MSTHPHPSDLISDDPVQLLGVSPSASSSEIKTAYHRKLREFPAHSHPQMFKAVREAYETLRKAPSGKSEPFLKLRPLTASLTDSDREDLKQLIDRQVLLNLNTFLRDTF